MLLENVIEKVKQLYPQHSIALWTTEERNNGLAKLFVDNHLIIKHIKVDMFEELLRMGGIDAERNMIKYFAEIIETKYIRRIKQFNFKKGMPALNLTEAQIRYAIENTRSNTGAARFLNVSFLSYRKYARMYGLYEQHNNKSGKGISKGAPRTAAKMEDIFANKHPNYHLGTLKERLIRGGYLPEQCELCGENEPREVDQQRAILLDFKDGNDKNMALENLRFICYNCAFKSRGRVHIRFAKRLMKQIEKELDTPLITNANDKSDDIFDMLNK